MKQIKNNFIFFGAVHQDFVFELKNDLIKYRTNPIKHSENYGGVAHNVAKVIAKYEKVSFFSLQTDKKTIQYLKDQKINFIGLNKIIQKRFYAILVNKFKKFQLGIAYTDAYENFNKKKFNFEFSKKQIILDLNFSETFIKDIINKYYKKNNIIICGTSPFKIYKVKNILKKINCLILNKDELYALTKLRNINKSINYITSINPYINLIVSNADKKTYGYELARLISCNPPRIKVVNENGAGDVMAGIYLYYRSKNNTLEKALSLGVAAGSLHAKNNKKLIFDYISIKKISNKIKSKQEKLNVK